MIRPLRKLHLAMGTTLALPVVVLYVLALGSRPSAPVADLGEVVAPPAPNDAAALTWSISGVSGWWDGASASVTVQLARDVVSPDMLLYCASPAPGGQLPAGAWMLGEIRPGERRRFARADHCAPGDELILFSLGHGVVVARAQLPIDGGGPP